jgi:hypothetical protein
MIMKLWVLIGIPKCIMAVSILAQAEKNVGMPIPPLKHQYEESKYISKDISEGTESEGYAVLQKLYCANLEPIMATWGAHQADFEWLEKRVIYGLFLADHTILDARETSCVNISGIMVQELEKPTMWHIRGLRRLGVTVEGAEQVCGIIKKVAQEVGGRQVDSWIKAADVVI